MQMIKQRESLYQKFVEQICKDCNCKQEEVRTAENVFTQLKSIDGMRRFRDDDTILKIICLNGKIICSAADRILPRCEELFGKESGAWFSRFDNLSKLEKLISSEGYCIDYAHHFYLPFGTPSVTEADLQQFRNTFDVKWYEGAELEQFRGDERFHFALSFLERVPDMLAVTAEKDGEILGMSGVSRDSDELWQIGIDVSPEARGKKLGACLTILVKKEVLRRGKLPFYGTVESHIQSQSVAVKSGFVPAWYELQTGRKKA